MNENDKSTAFIATNASVWVVEFQYQAYALIGGPLH
jgi:hypothetical protein